MTLVALLVGVIALLADILLRVAFYGGSKRSNPIIMIVAFAALLLAPVAAIIIQLAVSRRREFLADASAAEITNDAEGMALALRTLQLDQRETKRASRAVAHMYIESPLRQASGANALLGGVFSTHPPLEKRIAALEEAGGFRLAAV
jgi:heat shock protein HtpX